ncbi:MAG: UPF0149 family protein [Pseudomonadota bacterium]
MPSNETTPMQAEEINQALQIHEAEFSIFELQGFLAAIVCLPKFVEPNKWMSHLNLGQCKFNDKLEKQNLEKQIIAYQELLNIEISTNRYIPSFFLDEENADANIELTMFASDWAKGFLRGLEVEIDLVKRLFNPTLIPMIFPILMLYVDISDESLKALLPAEAKVDELQEMQLMSMMVLPKIVTKLHQQLHHHNGVTLSETIH